LLYFCSFSLNLTVSNYKDLKKKKKEQKTLSFTFLATQKDFIFFFLAVLGFEIRASD
jgi:hypothetical protein